MITEKFSYQSFLSLGSGLHQRFHSMGQKFRTKMLSWAFPLTATRNTIHETVIFMFYFRLYLWKQQEIIVWIHTVTCMNLHEIACCVGSQLPPVVLGMTFEVLLCLFSRRFMK